MSIRHVYIVTCDGCSAELPTKGNGIREARNLAKPRGWTQDKGRESVDDLCPACAAARRRQTESTGAGRGGEHP